MKILLDHCIDRNFSRAIANHEVIAAAALGWARLSNGALLSEAARQFDVFLTVDKNLRFQQNLSKLPLPVVEMDSVRNRIDDLMAFVPHLPRALELSKQFLFLSVKADGACETFAPRAS